MFASIWKSFFLRTWARADAQSPPAQQSTAHPRVADQEQTLVAGMSGQMPCWDAGPRPRTMGMGGLWRGPSLAKSAGDIKLVPFPHRARPYLHPRHPQPQGSVAVVGYKRCSDLSLCPASRALGSFLLMGHYMKSLFQAFRFLKCSIKQVLPIFWLGWDPHVQRDGNPDLTSSARTQYVRFQQPRSITWPPLLKTHSNSPDTQWK